MEVLQAFACNGVWGYPPARGNTSLRVHPDSLRVHPEIIDK